MRRSCETSLWIVCASGSKKSGGFGADSADAVLAASDAVPVDVLARARALAEVRHTPDFEALAVSFKRIRNILEQSGTAQSLDSANLDLTLLEGGGGGGPARLAAIRWGEDRRAQREARLCDLAASDRDTAAGLGPLFRRCPRDGEGRGCASQSLGVLGRHAEGPVDHR